MDGKYWRLIMKPKNRRRLLKTLGAFLILFLALEFGLNMWLRSGLRRGLVADSEASYQIETEMGWLRLTDIIGGRMNRISINARNCTLNDLRYSKLVLESRGFRFDFPVLLRERRLKITAMQETRINGVIDEAALNEYLNLRYPEYQSAVRIKPGGLIFAGSARVLNNNLPIILEGELKVVAERRLRFYPTRLTIAGRKVSASLLRIVGEQVPLEFGIMEGWPLQISDFQLRQKMMEVTMENISLQEGERRLPANSQLQSKRSQSWRNCE